MLNLEDLSKLDNTTFSKGLTKPTGPSRDVTLKMPDYENVHAELAKPNVISKLLWEEYVDQCWVNGDRFYFLPGNGFPRAFGPFDDDRHLSRNLILELASCNYIPHARNIILSGPYESKLVKDGATPLSLHFFTTWEGVVPI